MSDLPTKQDILDWVRENPHLASKRDIARAFRVKGPARLDLKRLLREMHEAGELKKGGRRRYRGPGALPPVAMLEISGQSPDGDLLARPQVWDDEAPAPRIVVVERRGDPALAKGDRMLARLRPSETEEGVWEARLIKKIRGGSRRALGVFRAEGSGGRLAPVQRGREDILIPDGETLGARDGELVEAEIIPAPRLGLRRAKVVEVLGDPGAARSISLIAIHMHGIPSEFSEAALSEAARARPLERATGGREDLTHLPLVTIDPPDARDHDDAVYAHPDDDPANEGGHVVWVAIADVAHYVRPGSALDREALRRGNSTYFPDRVAPMLPEALSGDLCSLREGVARPCIAVRMTLDAEGERVGHSFHRGLMRSPAGLTYAEVQAALDGRPDARTAPLLEPVLRPLYAAYEAAAAARERRQPLHLEIPERRIELSADGEVLSVDFRDRLEAHRLIEEFMILANVAAAETLERRGVPFLYRVHEEPNPEKLDALREQVEEIGLTLAKGQVLKTAHLNRLLDAVAGTPDAELINLSVLRAMTQAYYSPENYGHFGLNLKTYAHFTSPIRRYADLIAHRALIAAHGWGEDGLTPGETERLQEIADQVSMTERRSMEAERDTNDRYLAAFLAEQRGSLFEGRISGVAPFGCFVRLDETGADGLIPVSSLGSEYFVFDPHRNTLKGERSGKTIALGARATVRLTEATPLTGGLIFELVEAEGYGRPGPSRRSKGAPRRKAAKAKLKREKAARKARRR